MWLFYFVVIELQGDQLNHGLESQCFLMGIETDVEANKVLHEGHKKRDLIVNCKSCQNIVEDNLMVCSLGPLFLTLLLLMTFTM